MMKYDIYIYYSYHDKVKNKNRNKIQCSTVYVKSINELTERINEKMNNLINHVEIEKLVKVIIKNK